MTSDQAEYGYVAYIGEGGETGLTKVRPIDENRLSEWFVLSAVVMRAKWESQVVHWIREIRDGVGIKQRPDLHHRTLSPSRKVAACQRMAKLPLRGFVIASNKKNMRQHRNENAAKIPSQQWFYNWCIRLLLERATRDRDEFVDGMLTGIGHAGWARQRPSPGRSDQDRRVC